MSVVICATTPLKIYLFDNAFPNQQVNNNIVDEALYRVHTSWPTDLVMSNADTENDQY